MYWLLRPGTIAGVAALVVLWISLGGCYVTLQGYHMARDLASARPIERLESRGGITAEQAELFRNVEEIRRFGEDELGLQVGKVYTTYVATDRDYLVSVVSAARELSFERKEWWFPFFGRFPYRGYYRSAGAQRLARRLREDQWDVVVRPVEAFSTLGFFRDPLFSFMAHWDLHRLADVTLHEMAHATLWVRNEGQFNEEFATFVGREGAREFLAFRYGDPSQQLEELEEWRQRSETFRQDIFALRRTLEELYSSDLDAPEMRRRKAEIIAAFEEQQKGERDRELPPGRINNAFIDLFSTYSGNLHRFEELHRNLGGDLAHTIAVIIAAVEQRPRGVSPYDVLP